MYSLRLSFLSLSMALKAQMGLHLKQSSHCVLYLTSFFLLILLTFGSVPKFLNFDVHWSSFSSIFHMRRASSDNEQIKRKAAVIKEDETVAVECFQLESKKNYKLKAANMLHLLIMQV